jgi:small ubiquitin-related modifier
MSETENQEKDKKKINLKVCDASGNEIFFKIKRTTKFEKLMNAYCKRKGLIPGSVRFSFDGNRLNPDSTPDDIDIEEQDTIDAMAEQTGGNMQFFCI